MASVRRARPVSYSRRSHPPLLALAVALGLLWPALGHGQNSAADAPTDPSTNVEATLADAAVEPTVYARARVTDILEDGTKEIDGYRQPFQQLRLVLLSGLERGNHIEIDHRTNPALWERYRMKVGDVVIVIQAQLPEGLGYAIADRYRLPAALWVAAAFFALVVVLGGRRGAFALVGLAVSYLVLAFILIPRLWSGGNPILWGVGSAALIAVVSLTIAHGVRRRTAVALVGTLVTLGIATGLGVGAVFFTRLLGVGGDDALALQLGLANQIDLRGLLLVGIIIGTLGVLDDVTTTQAAAVDEIARANPSLTPRELFRRGLSVGRDHIAAVINTLALAYAGASLPLIFLFQANASAPAWVTVNSEAILEEVIRTVVGSAALVLAVPLTTVLAALWLRRDRTALAPTPPPAVQ